MSEAHAIEPELVTEPMSWVQICERYPDQRVALVELNREANRRPRNH